MLSIAETLKEFRTILLGYKIEVHTDHKNLVHETILMAFDRLMRWRLSLEEYSPEIHYIPGPENIVADAMSRIPMVDDDIKVKQLYARNISTTRESNARIGDVTEQCLLDVAVIARHQKTDRRQLR